ncbi:MAG: DeoR/GlpR family DNA-binding transcription regulator [Pseudomonadota bacterium]
MQTSERQTIIVDVARRTGRVTVESLATRFGVTPQTIRRDINELCQRGLLSRTHGGAVPSFSISNVGHEQRRALAADAKRRIAVACAQMIPDNASVMINIGTTTEQVARALEHRRDLMVVTNNVNVVNILSGAPGIELVVVGGVVRPADGGIVGDAAVDFIRQFRVDYAVMGASALDEDGTLLDYDMREVKVAQTILDCSRRALLVADAMKHERTAPVRIAHVSRFSAVVTDRMPPTRFARQCREGGVRIEIAGDVTALA